LNICGALLSCAFVLVTCMELQSQNTTMPMPQIVTSGVRPSRMTQSGTFTIQGIRLSVPMVQGDTSMHPHIEDVTLRMVKNTIHSTVASMNAMRIEIDRAVYMKETDSYSVMCYVANVTTPLASGTVRGSCTLELSAVSVCNGHTSNVARKVFVVNVAN